MSDHPDIYTALAAFQDECPVIAENSVNPHFQSKYADLPSIVTTIQPILRKHGLMVFQRPMGGTETTIEIQTVVRWLGGISDDGTVDSTLILPLAKKDPQAAGAAITYARRYSLLATLGIVTDEDDDANAAMPDRSHQPQRRQQSQRPAPGAKPPPEPSGDHPTHVIQVGRTSVRVSDQYDGDADQTDYISPKKLARLVVGARIQGEKSGTDSHEILAALCDQFELEHESLIPWKGKLYEQAYEFVTSY